MIKAADLVAVRVAVRVAADRVAADRVAADKIAYFTLFLCHWRIKRPIALILSANF